MSNWCYNRLRTDNNQVFVEFERICKLNQTEGYGQQLFGQGDYLFELEIDDNDLKYETKWTPNTDDILGLAIKYNFDYEHYYEELGNLIMGETKFIGNRYYHRELTDNDFDLIEFDEETEMYSFDGNTSDTPDQFYQELLDNKEWELV